MRKVAFTISTLAMVGVALADNPFRTLFGMKKSVQLDRCFDGKCGETFKCNEFHYCINAVPQPSAFASGEADPVYCGKKDPSATCAPTKHCNEFGFCIPGAPHVPSTNDMKTCGRKSLV